MNIIPPNKPKIETGLPQPPVKPSRESAPFRHGDIIQEIRKILAARRVNTDPPSIPIKMFEHDYLRADFVMDAVADMNRVVNQKIMWHEPITSLEKLGIILLAASADMDIFQELRERTLTGD